MTVSENTVNLFAIIQSVAVIVSVLFIAYQVWVGNKLTRAANMQSTFEMASPLNLELIKDREMTALWLDGAERFGKGDRLFDAQFRNLLTYWLLLHENIYYQYKRGLLDHDAYAAWEGDLIRFIRDLNVARHWEEMRWMFQAGFGDHLIELMMRDTSTVLPDSVKNSTFR